MQGADWIQTSAVDTDQQNQLSEKQPSASLSPFALHPSRPLSLNPSPSLSHPPLLHLPPSPLPSLSAAPSSIL